MPAIEPTRIRIQFFNNDVGYIVESLSSKYRSAFVEMAVIAWLREKEGQSPASVLLACGNAPNPHGPKAKRVRLQFFDQNAGQIVQSLSSKFRPAFVEMAVSSMLQTKEGKSAVKAFLVRGQDLEGIEELLGKISLIKDIENQAPPSAKRKTKAAQVVKKEINTSKNGTMSPENDVAEPIGDSDIDLSAYTGSLHLG